MVRNCGGVLYVAKNESVLLMLMVEVVLILSLQILCMILAVLGSSYAQHL